MAFLALAFNDWFIRLRYPQDPLGHSGAAVSGRFYLNCLGTPVLRNAREEVMRVRVRKHLALLIILVAEARPLRRDYLIHLLWPDSKKPQGRQSLATALSALRRLLGPHVIEADRQTVAIAPNTIRTDLARLEVGKLEETPEFGPLSLDGFLSGFDLPESSEFEHWRDRQHARWLPLIHGGLHTQIDQHRRTGNIRALERTAERLLAIDPFAEEGIRARMEARALAGDRLSALRLYDEWLDQIQAELNACPSETLEGMATRLRRRGWERRGSTHIPHIPTDQWKDHPFVGRVDEYRQLYQAAEASRRGDQVHILLTGDSGIGKTTLAARFATAIGLEGFSTVRTQCFEQEQGIPYATLSGLVRGLLDRPGAAATAPEALAEISQVVPQVRNYFPGLPEPENSRGEAARIYIAEAFLTLLLAVLDEHPVLLVLDDFDLADEATVAALHLILRRCPRTPLMLLVSQGKGSGASGGPRSMPVTQSDATSFRRVELLPLGAEECRELIGRLLNGAQEPSPAEGRALIRASSGIPMALILLIQDWMERGSDSLALSVRAMTKTMSPVPVEGYYQRLTDRMIKGQDPITVSVLQLAAVLDNRLGDLDMYSLIDVPAPQAMASLTQLCGTNLLRNAGVDLEFANQISRAHVYVSSPLQIRQHLHSRVADKLIEMRSLGGDIPGLEIAWQLVRASRDSESTTYLLAGAREAIDRGALHEAELALRTGIRNLSDVPRTEAILLLVEVLQEMARWEESLVALETLEEIPLCHKDRFTVLSFQAEAGLLRYDAKRLREFAPMLSTIISHSKERTTQALAAMAAAMSDFVRDEHYRLTIKPAISGLIPITFGYQDRARILLARARTEYFSGEKELALATIESALQCLRPRLPPSSLLLKLKGGIAAIHSGMGDIEQAFASFVETYDLAIRIGNQDTAARQAANLGFCQFVRGRFEESVDWCTKGLRLGGSQNAYHSILATAYTSFSFAKLGERQKSLNNLNSLSGIAQSIGVKWMEQAALLHTAQGFLYLEMQEEALTHGLRGTSGEFAHLLAVNFAGHYAYWILKTLNCRDDLKSCRAHLLTLLDCIEMLDPPDRIDVLWAIASTSENRVEVERFAKRAFSRLEALSEGARSIVTMRDYYGDLVAMAPNTPL